MRKWQLWSFLIEYQCSQTLWRHYQKGLLYVSFDFNWRWIVDTQILEIQVYWLSKLLSDIVVSSWWPALASTSSQHHLAMFTGICPGADPGEVKWVNFHPPFLWSPFFLSFFLSLKYWLVLLHYYKNSPPISKSWIRAWCHCYLGTRNDGDETRAGF